MALLYVLAGINHFVNPSVYKTIMPPYLPEPIFLIYLSGFFEIILGLLLLTTFRKVAAWGIILLLIAVFPANVQMAFNYWHTGHAGLWISLVRLPLQGLLVWWAWIFTRS